MTFSIILRYDGCGSGKGGRGSDNGRIVVRSRVELVGWWAVVDGFEHLRADEGAWAISGILADRQITYIELRYPPD